MGWCGSVDRGRNLANGECGLDMSQSEGREKKKIIG